MAGQKDRARFMSMLRDSIASLCKNGLMFDSIASVEGLIGITLNTQEVFLVNIKEQLLEACKEDNTVDPNSKDVSIDKDLEEQPFSPSRKRKKRRGSKSSLSEIVPYPLSTDSPSMNVNTLENMMATEMTVSETDSLIVINEVKVKTEQIAEDPLQSHEQYLHPSSDGNNTPNSSCVPSASYVQETLSTKPTGIFRQRNVSMNHPNSDEPDLLAREAYPTYSSQGYSTMQRSENILVGPELYRNLQESTTDRNNQGWGTHQTETEKLCPTCGKSFPLSNEDMLLDHIQNCKGVYQCKQFICPVCGVMRNSKTTLKVHIESIHSGQKFVCSGCGKKFNHRSSRSRHIIMGTCREKTSPNKAQSIS